MSVKVSPVYVPADCSAATPRYECFHCGKLFRREAILRRHRQFSHPAAGSDADSVRHNRCETCRRPFATRAALVEHLSAVHGTCCTAPTRKIDGRADDACLLPVVEDCCLDDEICITSDDGELQTLADRDDRVTGTTSECPSVLNNSSVQGRCDAISSSSAAITAVSGTVTSESQPSAQCQNNNNNQIRNKNMALQQVVPVSSTSSVNRSNSIIKLDGKLTARTSCVTSDCGSATPRRVSADTTTPLTGSNSSLSACRSVAEGPKPVAGRGSSAAHRVDSQQAQKSSLEADTLRGEVRKPGETRYLSTPPGTQKIIFYVKTEPNHHHQQIAYCSAAETVACGGGKAGASCQFVCPVCSREFVSEKYLSMHISSIHRTASDLASVVALETASAVSPPGRKLTQPGAGGSTPGNAAADVPVLSPATASATLQAAHPTPSTSKSSHWTCNICQKTFAQNSSYKNHIRTHSDDRPYVCGICSIGFKERYHLKKHELFKHTTTLNETCRICGKRFKDSTAVRAHERIHSDIRPYGCMLCGKTFKTSECLWHHENRSKTCGKMSTRAKQLTTTPGLPGGLMTVPGRQRQRRATVNTPSLANRQPHPTNVVRLPHQRSPPTTEDLKPEMDDLLLNATVCDETDCDVKAEVREESSNAEVGGDEVVIKAEPDCELFDVNLSAMLDTSDPPFDDIWPTLDDLDAAVPPHYGVDRHGIASSPEPPFCSSPDTTDAESTRSADESFVGMTSSVGLGPSCGSSKRYDCERCDKRFASAATLAKHLQVHAEVRPYRCSICDIGFKLKVHLKKHNLYRHSEEYPCECSICGKRFKDSSAVRLHERIHSTARPFQCAYCGKSFKTRENLWGHRNRGPCEQRMFVSPTMTSYPVSENAGAPQLVASNVRLFHSVEFGPILGVPVNAKLVFAGSEKLDKLEARPTSGTVHQVNVNNAVKSTTPTAQLLTVNSSSNMRRVSAVRIGDTTRLAVSKISAPTSGGSGSAINNGLSLVSVPTAVVTPIKRDIIDDRKLSSATTSVLGGNIVISTPATNYAGHVINRKRSGGSLDQFSPAPKSLVVDRTLPTVQKCSSIERLLSTGEEPLLSPDTEQNLADALSALAASGPDTMIVGGDSLPPIGDATADWAAPASGDYGEVLGAADWSELMSDQILTSTDDDDVISDGDSLSDYHRLVSSPSLGQSAADLSPTLSGAGDDESEELPLCADQADDLISSASDTMWCNWAPENDLGGLLL